jgi:LemA protein
MLASIILLVIIVLFIVLWIVSIFNRLVGLRNQVKNAWSQIDVQLERRYDLIPNLIECVKEYMSYERGTLEKIVQARNTAMTARETVQKAGGPTGASIKDLLAAEGSLKGALANVFALAENYPQLRASENMKSLQEELTSTENKVAFARQAYNDMAMMYNTYQQQFPPVMFAKPFGHHSVDLYAVEDSEAKKAVKVKF